MYNVSQCKESTVSISSQYPLCCPHNPTDICCCFLIYFTNQETFCRAQNSLTLVVPLIQAQITC